MLGLPSATIRSGQATSAATILLSWAYVVSSIVLVAELSFSAMEQDGVDEVSFTGLASSTLGADLGTVVVVVYAALSFSFIVAYVSGIGSLVAQLFPRARPAPFGHAKASAVLPSCQGRRALQPRQGQCRLPPRQGPANRCWRGAAAHGWRDRHADEEDQGQWAAAGAGRTHGEERRREKERHAREKTERRRKEKKKKSEPVRRRV
ncbi:hypothetical protein SEVIR_6G202750v4 [Setaria viridis]